MRVNAVVAMMAVVRVGTGSDEALEIFGSDGSVDVDLLKDTLKAQISKEGCMEISSIPIVGKLTFRSDDVDKVYDYIMKG